MEEITDNQELTDEILKKAEKIDEIIKKYKEMLTAFEIENNCKIKAILDRMGIARINMTMMMDSSLSQVVVEPMVIVE